MNKLTSTEAAFLSGLNIHLKPEANRQEIINLLRKATNETYQKGKIDGRTGYLGDTQWTDDQLR